MRISIYPGSPFAAKKRAVGRVDLVFEGIRQVAQITDPVVHTILDPEISMVGDVLQGGVDTKILHIAIANPKGLLVPVA